VDYKAAHATKKQKYKIQNEQMPVPTRWTL